MWHISSTQNQKKLKVFFVRTKIYVQSDSRKPKHPFSLHCCKCRPFSSLVFSLPIQRPTCFLPRKLPFSIEHSFFQNFLQHSPVFPSPKIYCDTIGKIQPVFPISFSLLCLEDPQFGARQSAFIKVSGLILLSLHRLTLLPQDFP